jgi:TonB family protein
MNSVVNFILESGVSLALLSLIYILFLRRETFFKVNRLFLLGSVLFSLILPLIKLRILNPQPVMLSEVTVTPYRNMLEAITIYSHGVSGSVEQAIVSTSLLIHIYLAGVIFFLGRFLFRIVQILLLIKKNKVQVKGGIKMVLIPRETSPFSFLKYVFVSESLLQTAGYDKMIEHELEHVKQGHSIDVIILQLLTVFQWFNPFMWMLNRAIRENHEFLADQAVLNAGVKRGFYKKLLLDQFVGEQLVIANNFNYSLIKKRIKMMSKIKSSNYAITKIVFGVLVAISLVIVFACEQKESIEPGHIISIEDDSSIQIKTTKTADGTIKIEGTTEDLLNFKSQFAGNLNLNQVTDSLGNVYLEVIVEKKPKILDSDEEIFFIVENMPEFPGGEEALRQHIANNVKYPEDAIKNEITGKVYVTFVVSTDGSIANAKIARGVSPSLDAEALRVINGLPKWEPGTQRGKTVNVSYTVPINFQLQ